MIGILRFISSGIFISLSIFENLKVLFKEKKGEKKEGRIGGWVDGRAEGRKIGTKRNK
jgi:hypothetical protein